jgi:hypothetical protein
MFGRTGLELSVLGFGCGAVGGLMVRGDPVDQERTIARDPTARPVQAGRNRHLRPNPVVVPQERNRPRVYGGVGCGGSQPS